MTATRTNEFDYAIIGGGVVGLSVAFGLLNLGKRIVVFDEGDLAFRASRGNFGLVWVQSKGLNQPAYAKWSQRSAAAWGEHANRLRAASGIDVALQQRGGYDFHMTDESLQAQVSAYSDLRDRLGGDYPFDVLGHNELRKEEAHISSGVAGAILHHQDGHVNPLKLLHALAAEVRRQGAQVRAGAAVTKVESRNGGYAVSTDRALECLADRVVLSLGLGARRLAPALGFAAPIRPERGQVLITEKLPPLMNRPAGSLRQVDEGSVQIGASAEAAGFDDRETLPIVAQLAANAVKIYPALARAKLLRSWSALRIMSPDGLPIYQQSKVHPGVFLITCHSGITLSAAHSEFLPRWLEGRPDAPDLTPFSEDRFDV